MTRMNWARVFLGALAWAVVFNLLGIAAAFIYLKPEMAAAWKTLGLPTSQLRTPMFMAFWLVLTYLSGLVAIWLYAAVRPRYGPGPHTAVGAGIAL